MVTVKVKRSIGLLVGKKKNGTPVFSNVFCNIVEDNGEEVEISEKDLKYIEATLKRVIKCQQILEGELNVPSHYRFMNGVGE